MIPIHAAESKIRKILNILFLLLIFSLGFLQPFQTFAGYKIPFSDLIFMVLAPIWILYVVLNSFEFRWHRFYWFLILYLSVSGISLFVSADIYRSSIKFISGFYLAGLAVLTFNIVKNLEQFQKVAVVWLFGSFFACLIGIFTIALFYVQPDNWLLTYTQNHYGAVPVGNYPRINSTFISASLFLNHLSVSLAFLLVAGKLGWIRPLFFSLLLTLILINSLFTISSGIGAIVLIICVWVWFLYRNQHRKLARISLVGGITIPAMFIFLNFVSLYRYPNAPVALSIPATAIELFPSSRFLVWRESFRTFLDHPVLGVGIGQNSCEIVFQNTDGTNSLLTDAHNTYLSVASQIGIFGFIILLFGIYLLLRELFPVEDQQDETSLMRFGIGLAFVSAFIYQGFLGSFEDTRHLWVLIGLILFLGKTNSLPSMGR